MPIIDGADVDDDELSLEEQKLLDTHGAELMRRVS